MLLLLVQFKGFVVFCWVNIWKQVLIPKVWTISQLTVVPVSEYFLGFKIFVLYISQSKFLFLNLFFFQIILRFKLIKNFQPFISLLFHPLFFLIKNTLMLVQKSLGNNLTWALNLHFVFFSPVLIDIVNITGIDT